MHDNAIVSPSPAQGAPGSSRRLRVCYADPPYLGLAKRLYGDPTYDSLDAHRRLVEDLIAGYPDGWALSLSEPSLHLIRPMCPPPPLCRVGAWVKTYVNLGNSRGGTVHAWEPVIFCGGRPQPGRRPTLFDWVSAVPTKQRGLPGAKPEAFCYWVFQMLGLRAGDDLVDLFPGSGAVTRAWHSFVSRDWTLWAPAPTDP